MITKVEKLEEAGLDFLHDLTNYHHKLQEKSTQAPAENQYLSPDETALISFNGYYGIGTPGGSAPSGAFLTIDTNITVTSQPNQAPSKVYDIALLVCLDGKNSYRYPFEGTFQNNRLVQNSPEGLSVDLTFTRRNETNSPAASFNGTITLPSLLLMPIYESVSGSTYNNPIPMELYAGTYFEKEISKSPKKVMKISSNGDLSFDFGTNDGILQLVEVYTYNINMYVFSFKKAGQSQHEAQSLIMGTSGTGGLVSNNMYRVNGILVSRSLLTIPSSTHLKSNGHPLFSPELASFSGYYPLPSIAEGAFVCILGQYVNLIGNDYTVMIALSLDGTSSDGYIFDSTMKFEGNNLKVKSPDYLGKNQPEYLLDLTFSREYTNPSPTTNPFGNVVTLTGKVYGYQVQTHTPLNVVPLEAFGGATMTCPEGIQLEVNSNEEVTLTGKQFHTSMKTLLYLPLMYMLAYPAENPTVVLSFGTSSLQGNTCIITTNNEIYVVHAVKRSNCHG